MRRTSALVLAAACVLAAGCAKKPAAKDVSTIPLTSAKEKRPNLHVSDDLMKLCAIHIDNVERAPKFAYDDADLLPADQAILEQIATCVTSGPLKGRKLALVGRADPRGESEYNMILGEYRAEAVHTYLAGLGVDPANMMKTSRGELDAEGKDEDSWARDRRVDVLLLNEQPVAKND